MYVSTINGAYKTTNIGGNWVQYYYEKSSPFHNVYGLGYDINGIGSVIGYTADNEVYFLNGENQNKSILKNFKLISTYPGYVKLDIDDSNRIIILDQDNWDSERKRLCLINSKDFTIDSIIILRSEIEERSESFISAIEVKIQDNIISTLFLIENSNERYAVILLFDFKLNLIKKVKTPLIRNVKVLNNILIASDFTNLKTYKSTDLGETWDIVKNEGGRLFILKNSIFLFTIRSDSIYVSSDSGSTWHGYTKWIISSNGIVTNNGVVFAISSLGIYKYDWQLSNWDRSDKGIYSQKIRDIAYDRYGTIYSVSLGVQKSTDNGSTWEYCGLDDQLLFNVLIGSNGYVYVAGTEGAGNLGGIFRSTDEGNTWQHFSEGLPIIVSDLYENKRGHIFAGSTGSTGYFLSTNYGETWTRIVKPGDEQSSCFSTNSEGHIFRGAYAGIVIRSTDDGETWEQMSEYFSGSECWWDITGIAFDPKGGNGYSICLKTTDNGRIWIQDETTPPDYSFCFDSLGNYFQYRYKPNGGYDIYRSSNKGLDWENISSGLEHKNFSHLSVSPDGYYFLGAEYGGLYRSRQKYVSVEETMGNTNDVIITPNPASDYIEISVGAQGAVPDGVSIFDVLGMEVQKSMDPRLRGDDSHFSEGSNVRLDVSQLAAGVYFVRVGDVVRKFVKM